MAKVSNFSTLRRRCASAYLNRSGRLWRLLPRWLRQSAVGRAYGCHLHSVVRTYCTRTQFYATFFLRNRSELELMRRLLDCKPDGATVQVAVLACSKGAEVYSIVWSLRSARPDLDFRVQAVDISAEIVAFASEGLYSLDMGEAASPLRRSTPVEREALLWNTARDQHASIFERLHESELKAMFDVEDNHARIKPWLKEGIKWWAADASSPELVKALGPQDLVVANRFLCHMEPQTAETCLRNIATLVKPGGHLFVSGVDLDVRMKVASQEKWYPINDLIREVYEGDPSLTRGWPLEYWGIEPFSPERPDWAIRYASAFQIGEAWESDLANEPEPVASTRNNSLGRRDMLGRCQGEYFRTVAISSEERHNIEARNDFLKRRAELDTEDRSC